MNNSTLPQGRDIGRTSDTPAGWSGFPIAAPAAPAPPLDPRRAVEPVTANECALRDISYKIIGLPAETRAIYNSFRALESLRVPLAEAAKKAVLWQSQHHAESQLGHTATANQVAFQMARGFGEEMTALAQIDAALKTFSEDPFLPASLVLLDDLHAERARLEIAVKTEREEKAQAHQAVIDAEKAAVEKAHAAAANDPDLQAAKARLASFDAPAAPPAPAPLVRGRVKLATDPLAADFH